MTPNPSESDLATAVEWCRYWAEFYHGQEQGNHITNVLAALASAQRDGKRLDWLQVHGPWAESVAPEMPYYYLSNVRDDVDAAMSKEQQL